MMETSSIKSCSKSTEYIYSVYINMSESEDDPFGPSFVLPEKFLDRLYDLTGTERSSTRGFVVCFVDSYGSPIVYTKTDNRVTEMGLRKALEEYLEEYQGSQIIDLGGDKDVEDSP